MTDSPSTPLAGGPLFDAEVIGRLAPADSWPRLNPPGIPPLLWLRYSAMQVRARCRNMALEARPPHLPPQDPSLGREAFEGSYDARPGPVDHRLWPEHRQLLAMPTGFYYLDGAAVSTGASSRGGCALVSDLLAAGWVLRTALGLPKFVPHLGLPHSPLPPEGPNATPGVRYVFGFPATVPAAVVSFLAPPWAPTEPGYTTARDLVRLLDIGAEGRAGAVAVYAVGGEAALSAYLRAADPDAGATFPFPRPHQGVHPLARFVRGR